MRYYAALALRPGSRGWTTDVCVPISRLADCITETQADIAGSHLDGALVGHVGDGNFHMIFPVNPDDDAEHRGGRAPVDTAGRTRAGDGRHLLGEHGVGLGKMKFLEARARRSAQRHAYRSRQRSIRSDHESRQDARLIPERVCGVHPHRSPCR